jgi:hypothetical protein
MRLSLLFLWLTLVSAPAFAQQEVDALKIFLGTRTSRCEMRTGIGTPEGVQTAPVCTQYLNISDGIWWYKATGTGNTGWATSTTGGTVTSVAMTVPTGLSIAGSPVTTAGTLAVSLTSGYMIPGGGTSGQILQSQGASAPAFSTATYPATGGTSGTFLRSDGTNWANSTLVLPNAASIGDLLVASGANTYGSQAPAALTKGDDTNVTLTLGGSASTALINAASITAGWTGTLSLARGGTAANITPVLGGVVYSTAAALAVTAAGNAGAPLISTGASAPSFTNVLRMTSTNTTATNKAPIYVQNNLLTTTAGQNAGFWWQLAPDSGGSCNTANPGANDFVGYYGCGESVSGRDTATLGASAAIFGTNIVLTANVGFNMGLVGHEVDIQNVSGEGTSVPPAWSSNGKLGYGAVCASTPSTDGDCSAGFSSHVGGTDFNDLWKYGFEAHGTRTAAFYARKSGNLGDQNPTNALLGDVDSTNFLKTTGTHTMLLDSSLIKLYGSSGGRAGIHGLEPVLDLYESDQAVDEKYWRSNVASSVFSLQTVNDAYTVASVRLSQTRSGLLTVLSDAAAGSYTAAKSAVFFRDAAGTEVFRIWGTDPTLANFNAMNLYIGHKAGENATTNNTDTGRYNTAIGTFSLRSNTTGAGNVAVGYKALELNTDGYGNQAQGYQALAANTTGFSNTAVGNDAMAFGAASSDSTGVGQSAINKGNATGCTGVGYFSLFSTSTVCTYATAIGWRAFSNLTSATSSVAIGAEAARRLGDNVTANTASTQGVYIGALSHPLASGATNEIVIGYAVTGNGDNTATIGNSSQVTAYITGAVWATKTTEQLRVRYDASNYWTATTSSAGAVTLDAVGASAGFALSDPLTLSTSVNGGVVYSTATSIAISAAGSAGQLLRSAGAAAPTWSTATFSDTATTTGAYLRADGTNWIMSTLILPNAITANRVVYGSATDTYGSSANLTFDGTRLSTTAFTNSGNELRTGVISPTQLVANTDDWNPTGLSTANVIRLDIDAARTITGIVAQTSGTMILLYNTSAFTATLSHDATSTAANRFYAPGAVDFSLTQKKSIWIRYDGTHTRWTIIG